MFSIIRALIQRFKAMFVVQAVLELEAELAASWAERRAELYRLANQYDEQGLHTVAQDLREQADSLSPEQPLASVLATVAHLEADQALSHANGHVLPGAGAVPPSARCRLQKKAKS